MSGTGNENEVPNHRRSTRARKQREANPCDFLDEEEDAASAAGSPAPSSDSSSTTVSNNPSSETRLARPAIHRHCHWRQKRNEHEFSYVDGANKFFRRYARGWGYTSGLNWYYAGTFVKAEKALVEDQDTSVVSLEVTNFGSEVKLTQVPYHADLLPYYEYFAQGIQQHSDLESFRISNYHLPPSPWLGDNVLPSLEATSTLTDLTLSNCSLSGEDLASLAKFLQGNTTLGSIDLSKNNIDSEETVKLLTKAIQKHPALSEVNLSFCSLGGGNCVLDKLLLACKAAEIGSLHIGHKDMDSEAVASIAKFVGEKNSLTVFSLVGARLDKDNKKALEASLVKNKTIESLCLSSNGLALPGILRATKKAMKSLSRLTTLDLSFNSLPAQGAKALAKFLEHADCSLESLVLSNNHLTTKGANHILPALNANESLEELDLSRNWLNDAVGPAVVDLLQNNSTLLSLDLRGNKSLKSVQGEVMRWKGPGQGYETIRKREDRGKAAIVNGALFDTTSLHTIANSNHTCAVRLSGQNTTGLEEETIRKINEMDVAEGMKIRYKVVLALTQAKTELRDPRSFNDVPLELMPLLLELMQQEIGVGGFADHLCAKSYRTKTRVRYNWNATTRRSAKYDPNLDILYQVIMGWQSFPLLFVNGAGELPKVAPAVEATKKTNRKRRRKFGEEDDDDDEPFIPKGARKTAKWVRDDVAGWRRIPPPVY